MQSTPTAPRASRRLRAREQGGAAGVARPLRHPPFTPGGGPETVRAALPASWTTSGEPGAPWVSTLRRVVAP